MNTNDLNTALYEKMAAEQDKYRDWLKSQPPEEILHHTYEYTVREDIVMAMEELELTDAQAQALLESPSPLADVYHYFEKLETGYMDVIRDSIESRANEVCKEPEELNPMVVYLHSASYATKHGETDAYWLDHIPIQRHFPQISTQIFCSVLLHLLMDYLQFLCGHPKQNRNIPLTLCHSYRSGSRFFGAAGLWTGSSCLSFCRTEPFSFS